MEHRVVQNKQKMTLDTVGEVAAARSGSKPPQDAIRLSASCDITCVTFTANT